ncbi:hypothetical protein B4U79_17226, partial [Dinothrombium tinctorium]
SHVIRFENFTQYDFRTDSFLRLSKGFPRILGNKNAFEGFKGELTLATQTLDRRILFGIIYELNSTKEEEGNCYDMRKNKLTKGKRNQVNKAIHIVAASTGLIAYYRLENGSYLAIYSDGDAEAYREYVLFFRNNRFDFKRPSYVSPRMMLGCPPELCVDSRIDAMVRKKDSNDAYIVYGSFAFLWNVQYKVPDIWNLLSRELPSKHNNLDAAFYEPRSKSYYFFKENKVYRDHNATGILISNLFHRSGFDENTRIDAAVCYAGYVYVFKEQSVYKYKVMYDNNFLKEDQMRVTSFMHTMLPDSGEKRGPRNWFFRFQLHLLNCSSVRGAELRDQKKQIEEEVSRIKFTTTTPLNVEITTTRTSKSTSFSSTLAIIQSSINEFETFLPEPLTHPSAITPVTFNVMINFSKDIFPHTAKIRRTEVRLVLMAMSLFVGLMILSIIASILHLIKSDRKCIQLYSTICFIF